jgi:hypothetical protein
MLLPIVKRLVVACVLAALLAGPAEAAPAERTSVSDQPPALRYTVLRAPARTLLAQRVAGIWGGAYTTSTGETVRVFSSDAYAADVSFNQARAETIAHLPHGSELASLTAYFLTVEEMQSVCGGQALACYSPQDQAVVALGEDAPNGTNAESILTHEYGHHLARNRINTPWQALDWGTKRWATYMRICPRERDGEVFPGDALNYELDPAEGFAESYRVMAETRMGKEAVWWGIVDSLFFPDEAARAAVEQDVVAPWTGNTSLARSGRVAAAGAGRVRSFRIATPLDGMLRVTVRPPAKAEVTVSIGTTGGSVLARTGKGVRSIQTTVCGEREVVVRVHRIRGAGRFQLAISRP